MKWFLVPTFAATLVTGLCFAQSTTSAQSSATVSQDSSVSAGTAAAQSASSVSASQKAQASQEPKSGAKSAQAASSSQLKAGSTIHATLSKRLDAKKAKPGDEVVAKTNEDAKSDTLVIIPKGSKILGHVTEAQPHVKGHNDSQLGIAFDRAVLKDGHEIPLAVTLQAIGSTQANAASAMDDTAGMNRGSGGAMAPGSSGRQGGGVLGGAASTAGGVANTVGNTAGSTVNAAGGTAGAAGTTAGGHLTSRSQGVIGLSGLTLSGAASNSTQGSVISSRSGTVQLDSGTEMILRVNNQ